MQRSPSFRLLSLLGFVLISSLSARVSDKRIHLVPQFTRGAVLRYSIETRNTSNGHTATPILNPEGASQYKQSTRLVVRLDVLDVQPSSQTSHTSIGFRATFEQAHADSQADAYAPEAGALDDAIEKLETHSFEFSVDSANNFSGVAGLDQIATNREVAARVLSWMKILCGSVRRASRWHPSRSEMEFRTPAHRPASCRPDLAQRVHLLAQRAMHRLQRCEKSGGIQSSRKPGGG